GGVAGTGNGSIHVSSGRVRRRRVIPKIVATPIAPLALPEPRIAPRRVAPEAVAAALPGPGRDRLAGGEVLVITTGQQPGLFTGPLYTVYKALSAIALARRLERERRGAGLPGVSGGGADPALAAADPTWFLDARVDANSKRAAAPWVLKGLDLTLPDDYTPVMVEARQGRDRLQRDADAFVTRRSGERFTRAELERVALEAPERLSPNVLLRPVVEAALLPTVAYAAGPAELQYLQDAVPLYDALGVTRQPPVPRWSGVIVEGRVEKLMERHGIDLAAFDGKPGELEARLVRHELPPETVATLATLRSGIEEQYGRLLESVVKIDPTLERTVESARNAALAGAQTIEKKLVASLKRLEGETLVRQIARARAAVYPAGQPQERVLTLPSFLIRYGPGLVDALEQEVARW